MNLGIYKMSLKALKLNKVRSSLTTLGIIIGTAIVIIALSVGAGIEALVLEGIWNITSDTLYVEVQVPIKASRMAKNFETAEAIGQGVEITSLKNEDLDDIKKLDNVEMGYGMSIAQQKLTYSGNEQTSLIFAVGTDYAQMESLTVEFGRFFTDAEDEALAQVIVLGSELKQELFGDRDALNKNVKINQQNYKVIGVAEEIGSMFFMNMDDFAYLPIQTTQKKLLGVDHFLAMGLRLKDETILPQTVDQIEKIMRINHGITDPEKDDFAVRTKDEAMDIISSVTDTISILLFAIAFISLIVGGVGIMNVMYVAVTERTNEIGLKKALGAKPAAIRIQFLTEAAILTTVGGVVGIGVGIGISWLVSFVAGLLEFNWPFVVTTQMLIISFSIPVVIGLIFGYAPAQKAALMNPIDALRHA